MGIKLYKQNLATGIHHESWGKGWENSQMPQHPDSVFHTIKCVYHFLSMSLVTCFTKLEHLNLVPLGHKCMCYIAVQDGYEEV